MNIQEADVLIALTEKPYSTQRALSLRCGHSLGVVNRSIRNLTDAGYLNDSLCPTEKAEKELREKAPQNAIILAAGFGMRMVPINTETPKGLLEVHGEPLIERSIRQLHAVGIREIYVVVGFMKEQYEYLIDEYGVELIVNSYYAEKNNLHSLRLALPHLSNSYIIPCDIWCDQNPYRRQELYSWYMVSNVAQPESVVRINRKGELVAVAEGAGGNAMIGISYLTEDHAKEIRERIAAMDRQSRYDDAFWEEALLVNGKMIVHGRVVPASQVVEINTYEQLRELDSSSNQLRSDALCVISKALAVPQNAITNITVLKKGMTNRSFLFQVYGKKYIMRIPGEGTDLLINRREEAAVYRAIDGRGICDDIAYMSPENGYKITEFLENSRVCDPDDPRDLERCMNRLRAFHDLKLKVDHEFDIFKQIDYYESLWEGKASVYRDYPKTKANVLALRPYIERHRGEKVLTHIDAVPDNFLFTSDGDVRLIDWEYAAMQDPHVDIAMFCIYAMYNRQQIDRLIDFYFQDQCPDEIRIKIYCYIAACGLLWSNWCEYKRSLGVEFGEYSLRQYRFAKDYYRIVAEELQKRGERLDV